MEKQTAYVLMSSVGGMRFVHGVASSEEGAKKWVESCSKAYKSSGADYHYRDYVVDDPRA